MNSKGFTLIELLVSLAIVAILAALITYTALEYINRGKDAAVQGGLSLLVTGGESWYDKNDNSYCGFCDSLAVRNTRTSIASEIKCNENQDTCNAWAACAAEFLTPEKAFCVDNRGVKKEIKLEECTDEIIACP